MKKIPKFVLTLAIVFAFVGCDQATKSLARQELRVYGSLHYFGGLIRLQYAENEGGFLSVGSELPVAIRISVAILLTLVVLIGFAALLMFVKDMELHVLVSYSILIAGALGNLIDRLMNQGRVVDFLIIGSDTVHTGIFNLADVLILAGTGMILINQLVRKRTS
jgi:signal peptidase II